MNTSAGVKEITSMEELATELAQVFPAKGETGIFVHQLPARDFEQVVEYANGDAHDRSKLEFFDGEKFHSIA